jgi:hypothetical protein
MTDVKQILALLDELERENNEVQAEIDRLIGEMETVPPEQRSDSDWGPKGRLTMRYLELSERQNELAADIQRVFQAIEAATPKPDTDDKSAPTSTKH